MSWTTNPTAQREDMDAWLRGITDCLTPKTIELLLFLIIIIILRRFLTHDSSQNQSHVELTKITCSLSNAFTAQLKLSHQHVTHLQEELTRAQSRIDKLEVKVQDDLKTTEFLRELTHTQHCKDQLKASDEAEHETKTQVDKLQEALAVTERDKQELKTVQKHLENQLQSAEHQLEKAKADIESKNSKLTALEDHLRRCSVEIDHLTQQQDDANDKLYAVRNEFQHVFTQKPEPRRERPPSASSLLSRTESSIQELSSYGRSEWPHPKTSPAFTTELFPANQQREIIQPDSKAATGMTFKDLNQLAKNITQFDPNSTEGHCIQAYLQDIDFLLEPNSVAPALKPWSLNTSLDVVPQSQLLFLQPVIPTSDCSSQSSDKQKLSRKHVPMQNTFVPHPPQGSTVDQGPSAVHKRANHSHSGRHQRRCYDEKPFHGCSLKQDDSETCTGYGVDPNIASLGDMGVENPSSRLSDLQEPHTTTSPFHSLLASFPQTCPDSSVAQGSDGENMSDDFSPSSSKRKRFCNTYNILNRSGLLGITLRTKELIRQNKRSQAQLQSLQAQTDLFLEAIYSGDPKVWTRLQLILQNSRNSDETPMESPLDSLKDADEDPGCIV